MKRPGQHPIAVITGAAGFIGSYLSHELLEHGYRVIGVDNFSKYGRVDRMFFRHPNFELVEGDAASESLLDKAVAHADVLVAAASLVGGIAYFNAVPFDIFANNEQITIAALSTAIRAHAKGSLSRFVFISSSMVFESGKAFPSREGDERMIPPPRSAYGFQKLAAEMMVCAAADQYGLPYTICRPFNCIGIGEPSGYHTVTTCTGNRRVATGHVLPDFIEKLLDGAQTLEILGSGDQIRHYTYCGDVARGIRLSIERSSGLNEDFNLASDEGLTVLQLAKKVWKSIRPDEPFKYTCVHGYEHDVACRIPSIVKAEALLGFRAKTPVGKVITDVAAWMKRASVTTTENPNC